MNSLKSLPIPSIILTVLYILAMVVFKWGFVYNTDIVLFVGGSMVGLIMLDVFDVVFPDVIVSPRTIIGEFVFVLLSFFVVTSSGSITGGAVVLALLLRILTEQFQELVQTRRIVSWLTHANMKSSQLREQVMLWGGVVVFVLETYVFYSAV